MDSSVMPVWVGKFTNKQPMLDCPQALIGPHEAQAMTNHQQTLDELAARGGLHVTEVIAIIEDRAWRYMTDAHAVDRYLELLGK